MLNAILDDEFCSDIRARIGQELDALTASLVDGDVRSMQDYRYICGQIDGLRQSLEFLKITDADCDDGRTQPKLH